MSQAAIDAALAKMQAVETIVEKATVFVSSIPQMIRDALAAANTQNNDQPLLDLADTLEGSSQQLNSAMLTTSAGAVAPVGNLPAGAADTSNAGASTTAGAGAAQGVDPNAPQSGVQASDTSNQTIDQSQVGSQTAQQTADAASGSAAPVAGSNAAQ